MCRRVEKSLSTSGKGLMNQIIKAPALPPFAERGGRGDSPHWRHKMTCETSHIGVQKKVLRVHRFLKFLRFFECASSRTRHFDRWDLCRMKEKGSLVLCWTKVEKSQSSSGLHRQLYDNPIRDQQPTTNN